MLSDILTELSAEHGLVIDDPGERALAIRRVNKAAKEIYDMGDLFNLTDEVVVDLNVEEAQVTLPEYMGHVRGMRFYDRRYKVSLDNQFNRFQDGCDTEVWPIKNYREKSRSPLARNIDNESLLVFTIPLVENTNIEIAIQGSTSNSQRFSEKIALATGSLIARSLGNYKMPMFSIRKNIITSYDIIIKDVDDNELGRIPNCQYNSSYIVYQIYDNPYMNQGGPELAVEVLYKKRFIPFQNNDDQFIGGEDYDSAIIWKYLEHRAKDPKNAILFRGKCSEVLNGLTNDPDRGKRKKINFVPRPFFNMKYVNYGPSKH